LIGISCYAEPRGGWGGDFHDTFVVASLKLVEALTAPSGRLAFHDTSLAHWRASVSGLPRFVASSLPRTHSSWPSLSILRRCRDRVWVSHSTALRRASVTQRNSESCQAFMCFHDASSCLMKPPPLRGSPLSALNAFHGHLVCLMKPTRDRIVGSLGTCAFHDTFRRGHIEADLVGCEHASSRAAFPRTPRRGLIEAR